MSRKRNKQKIRIEVASRAREPRVAEVSQEATVAKPVVEVDEERLLEEQLDLLTKAVRSNDFNSTERLWDLLIGKVPIEKVYGAIEGGFGVERE